MEPLNFDFLSFANAHKSELSLGVAGVIITLVITEVIKPWVKLGLERARLPAKLEASALRSISFVVTLLPVLVLDFKAQWQAMTQTQIDTPSALLAGSCLTWAASQVVWLLAHDLQPIRALRARLYRSLGVGDLDKS